MKNKKIKVLMVVGGYTDVNCGIADYSCFLCNNMAVQGASVSVITSSYLGIKEEIKPVKVLPVIDDWKVFSASVILKKITALKPDIVHFQYPNSEYKKNLSTNLLPSMIRQKASWIKIVQTYHEPINELTFLGRLRFLLNFPFADGFIFVEKENYLNLKRYLRFFVERTMKAFIPIASNIPRVKPDNKTRSKIVRSMKLNGKKKIIMTFGFINQVKGYEQLLDAIDTLKYDWIHIGSIDEKVSYQAAFIKNAEKKGVRIKFTGFLSGKNIAKYLASSDVCVFPFKEGVTNRHGTFLAAAGQGVYIVACHKSKRGYIKNENVYYAAPGDIEELKKGIEFDKHIKKITPNVPSWKQVAKRHLDFYREILNKK